MPESMSIYRIITELIFPIFALFGVMARIFGALGIGIVAGSVLRRSVLRDSSVRFHTPLIFIAAALLIGVTVLGPWSSPGTLAMVGIGLFIGYMFLEHRATPNVVEGEVVEVEPEEVDTTVL
jgi:hypothetical protein